MGTFKKLIVNRSGVSTVYDVGGVDDSEVVRFIEDTTTINGNPDISYIRSNFFQNNSTITSVYFPNCITINNQAFYTCQNLSQISFPKCEYVGSYAFNGTKIENITLPKCKSYSVYAFPSTMTSLSLEECLSTIMEINAPNLLNIYLPRCEYLGNRIFGYTTPKYVYLPKCSYIGTSIFRLASDGASIYIGTSLSYVCSIVGDPFSSVSYIPSCSIYVPLSLVNDYKSASYWSNYSSYFVGI